MAEEPKKISFGFSKISKKPVISVHKKVEKEIQFIDCLEGNSIKILNGKEETELPIIPLKNGNILRDNMIEALKARKDNTTKVDLEKIHSGSDKCLKSEKESKPLTLDELAAKEILEDLKKVEEAKETEEVHTIYQVKTEVSEKESTLDDYENMPVNQFGLAVLRGMGWAPDKGIGKNAQIVKPVNPVLRPKGMGLGADKVIQTPKIESKEELILKKGVSIKVISGPYKGLYGKLEGFDELPGRIIVRLTLQNIVISISENLVEIVTLSEYNKNSKILNLKEYNDFLDKKKLVVAIETAERATENKVMTDNHKKGGDFSSEDESTYKKHRNTECYKIKDNKRSDYISDVKPRKHKYSEDESSSSDSSPVRRIKYKFDSHKSRGRRHKSSKYDNDKRIEIDSGDSDSSLEKKKSKPKKHHKNKFTYRSRSRSRSATKKKKKKRCHRSRS